MSVLLRTVLVALAIAAIGGHCSITLLYGPSLSAVVPNLFFGDGTTVTQRDLIRATNISLFNDVDLFLSPFITPALASPLNFTNQPIVITSMCLASTVGNSTGLTLKQIGAALAGNPDAQSAAIQWYIAPPAFSPTSTVLLQALIRSSVDPFTTTASWPASVLSNPNVHILPDDQSVSAAIKSCPSSVWCVGPQLSYAPWAAPTLCMRTRHDVELTGDIVSHSNRLTADSYAYTVVDPFDGAAYSQGPVYPFIGALYLTVRRGLSCDKINAVMALLTAFFTNSSNSAALMSMGLQGVSATSGYTILNFMRSLAPSNCALDVLTAPISGDVFLYDAIAALNYNWFLNSNYMVAFNIGSTSDVLGDLYSAANPAHAALTEGLPNATLQSRAPSIVAAPIFAHGLSIVYTLDGRDGLVVSFCTLLGMLNGTIRYWDDPALIKDNVGIQLPHTVITRVMSYGGSQEAAARGITYIARRCGTPLAVPFTAYPFLSEVTVTGAHNIAFQVQKVEGAIGLAPTSTAVAASMPSLSIVFPSGQQRSGSQNDLAAVVEQSWVNATTKAFTFPSVTSDYYPFVAVVYAIFDTDASGDCAAYSRTLAWLSYVVGASAANVLTGISQAVLTEAMRAPVVALIAQARCDGVVLFPVAAAAVLWWPYAVVGASAFALGAALIARSAHRYVTLSVRPTDSTKAIAVMFVGIKNQGAVLESGDENAAAVHQHVADTVRRFVRKHRCYEARRIDAATMMIVAHDAARAVACAEDIVLALSVDVPWLETVMTHPMDTGHHNANKINFNTSRSDTSQSKRPSSDTASREGADAELDGDAKNAKRVPSHRKGSPHTRSQSKVSSSLGTPRTHTTSSGGLTLQQCVPEVYAGVHWTHVMMDAQDDAVSYHGAGVNAAAGVADLAVGGQVVVSRTLMDALSTELGDAAAVYSRSVVGEGTSSDDGVVGMSLTTARFPDWLVARAALRRKSLEEKGGQDGNMIAAAMASADGTLARRRVASVSMLVRDLLNDDADHRAAGAVSKTLAELVDIVTANRGQIHSITDGVVTATIGAGAPVAMAPARAAQIAMEASGRCIAIGVNSGSALVGNSTGGKAVTVGRVIAGAALMRLVAARTGVTVCASDVTKADLAAKFELATVDLVAAPWDNAKHIRCYAVVEERVGETDTEWLYDLRDGFASLEQRFDDLVKPSPRGTTTNSGTLAFACRGEASYTALLHFDMRSAPRQGNPSEAPRSGCAGLPDRHRPYAHLSDVLYAAVSHATEVHTLQDFSECRLADLGQFSLINGRRAVVT